MSSEGHQTDSLGGVPSDDENFSREVTSHTRLLVKSKFGEETLFGALSLDNVDNVDNVPRLSRSEAFARMLQKGNDPPPQA